MKATEQMVSVPRDEVERLVKLLAYQAHPHPSPHAEFWQGLLDAPAQHHQVEPAAVVDEGDDGLFTDIIYGEDGSPLRRGDKLYTHPAPAAQNHGEAMPKQKPVMRLECEKLLGGDGEYAVDFVKPDWLQECREKGGTFLLCTHADPGEVERLRAELESSYTVAEHERLVAKGQEINVSCIRSLRAQLAERDALLRDAGQLVEFYLERLVDESAEPEDIAIADQVLNDIKDISASAEPSAPVIHPINMKTMMQAYEKVDHKAMLHGTSNWCAAMAASLRGVLQSESSAPVEIDERAEFEAWKLRSQVGEHTNAGAALTASRRGPSVLVDRAEWVAVSGPGQIQIGDWLSFSVAGKILCAQAKEILNPGSAKEEIIYNRKKNHYFITTMAIAGTSSHRGVMQARASLGQTTDLSVIADAKRWRFYAPKVAQIIGESLSEMCRVVDSAMPNPACAICKDLGDQCMECSEQANLNALLKTTPGDNGPDTEHGDF